MGGSVPDRATILAATPKCPHPVLEGLCCRPLRWAEKAATWWCEVHDRVLTGAQAAMLEEAAA
jgi:hypothetical protein